METFVPVALAIATVWKLVDFAKYVRAGMTVEALTQLTVWVAGIGMAFLLAASSFADGIPVGDLKLGTLNWAGIVFFGLGLGSTASGAYETFGTSATPKLFKTTRNDA